MNGYKEHLLVICLFLVLVFIFTVPFALRPHNAVVSSHVDNLLNVWIMSWDGHAVVTSPGDLFQANIDYPSPDSLAYSEHLFIIAMIAAPIAWITRNPVFAYNFVSLIGFALCGYTMYLLVKYLTRNRLAAIVSGIFFALVPYHFSTIVHVHVSLYFLQPLILLFLFRYCDEGRTRYLAGLGIAFLAQALLGWYQLAFSSIPIALFFIWRLVSRRRREYLKYIIYAAVVLVLCMVLVIPFAIPYFRLHRNIPEEEQEPAINVISHASVKDYFRVLPQNYFYDKLGFFAYGNAGEGNALFPGFLIFPLAVLALVFVFSRRRRGRESGEEGEEPPHTDGDAEAEEPLDNTAAEKTPPPRGDPEPQVPRRDYFAYFVVLGLVCFVLSLGPEPHGVSNIFYKVLHKLPIYGFVRFPIRYHIMVILSLAVVAGYGCTYLYHLFQRRKNRTWGALAVAAVALLMVLEFLVVSLPYSEVAVGDAVPRVYRDLDKIEEAVIVEAPMPFVANSVVYEDPLTINYGSLDNTFISALREQDAGYFSVYHWKKMLNGMSGYFPLFYRRALVEMLAFPGPRALDFLRGTGVTHIVMHWDYYQPEQAEEVRRALEDSPVATLIEDYPDGISLYELPGLETSSAADLDLPLYLPGKTAPGLAFNASLAFLNHTGRVFINSDETRQHLRLEWKDASGNVLMTEETYLYAPFYIPHDGGAAASFRTKAPAGEGEYVLTVTAVDGILEGTTWVEDIVVTGVASVDSGEIIDGSLALAGSETEPADANAAGEEAASALRLYPGDAFSLEVEAANGGGASWQRERETVEGSVVITAAWTREGDPEYEMIQQGMLPCDISPGQILAFPIALQAPTETGSYTLTLRLNCLGVTLIGDPIVIPVTVTRETPPAIEAAGG